MAERFEIVEKALLSLLNDKKYSTLRDILITMNPSDIAALFDSLEDAKIPLLFRLLPKELAAETFVEMEPDAQELLIRAFMKFFIPPLSNWNTPSVLPVPMEASTALSS